VAILLCCLGTACGLLLVDASASAALAAPRQMVMKDLGTLDGSGTVANAINDRRQASEFNRAASDVSHAVIWTPKSSPGRPDR
jgi:hypothetical protein